MKETINLAQGSILVLMHPFEGAQSVTYTCRIEHGGLTIEEVKVDWEKSPGRRIIMESIYYYSTTVVVES